jgi:ribosomal protein S18 acetylase RimI-like enzyme
MNIINQWPLQDDFSLAEVDKFPNEIYEKQLNDHLLNEYPFLMWQRHLPEEAKEKIKELSSLTKDGFKLRIALLKNDEMVGFSFGWQENPTMFFMAASLVLPEYRKMGLYSKMAEKVLEISKEKGFQSVSSFHVATNNPVIISKLKLGFTISGLQLDAVHGVLVRLIYHHNDLLKSATRFRAGAMGEVEVRDMLISTP